MTDHNDDAVERFHSVSRDLYIEIFGVLVPGFFFLLLTFFAVVIPIDYVVGALGDLKYTPALATFISQHAIITFTIALFAAYVAGHIFYRSDPKNPDFASIKRLPEGVRESGCVRTIDHNAPPTSRYRYNGSEEFPYGHLHDYLIDRGFDELADYVLWDGHDFEVPANARAARFAKRKKRTKHLINRMKLAVKNHHRLLFFEITRNEAHIRLMSSLWYLSWYVLCAAAFGIAVMAGVFSVQAWVMHAPLAALPSGKIEAVLYPLSAGVIAVSLLRSIEGFFHYQRVREIVFVLEALHVTKCGGTDFPRRSMMPPEETEA